MQVRVLRAGVFNGPGRPGDPRHKVLPWAGEGDLIEVADGAYAESLVADGWVAAVGLEEEMDAAGYSGTRTEARTGARTERRR